MTGKARRQPSGAAHPARALALAALGLLAIDAAPAGTLDLDAAWGGRFRPGETAQVGVALQSERGGTARVQASSGGIEVSAELNLAAGEPGRLALPVRPGADGRVAVEALLPDGSNPDAALGLEPVPPGVALAFATPAAAAGTDWLAADPARLPVLPEGYGPVSALALAPADLKTLDPAQTRALARFLGGCGTLVLSGASARDLSGIRMAAGCGGRRVVAAPGPLAPLPDTDTNEPRWDLAQSLLRTDLQGAEERARESGRRIALLFLPYALLLGALLLWRRPRPWAMVAVPALAALLVWQSLPRAVVQVRTLTWAETESGDPSLRFATLIETVGDGQNPSRLSVDTPSEMPLPLDGGGLAWHLEDSGGTLEGPDALLSTRRYLTRGIAPSMPGLSLEPEPEGLRIRNGSGAPIADAWLVAGDCARRIPSLPAGETLWRPQQTGPDRSECGAPAPLQYSPRSEHAPTDLPRPPSPALVLALPPGSAPAPTATGRVWLILHPRRTGA